MTTREPTASQLRFLAAFEAGTEGLKAFSAGSACPGCEECGLADVESMEDPRYEIAGEPSFSWQRCEVCRTSLGGDRHPAHYSDDAGKIQHARVCTDCVLLHANGALPDAWRAHAGDDREA